MANPPVIIHDWKSSVNNLVTNSDHLIMRRDLLFEIKERWKGGSGWLDMDGSASSFVSPWQTDYSATSSVAGAPGDGVDRWGSPSDVTWGVGLSSNRAWHVLVHPDFFDVGEPLYILIDCTQSTSGQNHAAIGVYFSRAGFTGGATNARPTATDEAQVNPSNGTNATAGWQGHSGTGATSRRFHFQMSDDGRMVRIWVTHDGACVSRWEIIAVENPPSAWTHPVLVSILSGSSTSELNVWSNNWLFQNNKAEFVGYDDVFGLFKVAAGMYFFETTTPSLANRHHGKSIESWSNSLTPGPIPLAILAGEAPAGILEYIPDCWWGNTTLTTGNAGQDEHGNDYAFAVFGDMVTVWPRVAPVM